MTAEREEKQKRADRSKGGEKLGWKDYIALIIAMLTTTLLPILIIIVVLLVALVVVIFLGRV